MLSRLESRDSGGTGLGSKTTAEQVRKNARAVRLWIGINLATESLPRRHPGAQPSNELPFRYMSTAIVRPLSRRLPQYRR